MDYQRIYNEIISKAKDDNRIKVLGGVYYENHHILPRCLGGDNSKFNLVLLTAREHFVCHKLLIEIYPNDKNLIHAIWLMVTNNRVKVSSREFERIKLENAIELSKKYTGRKNSKEHNEKIRVANLRENLSESRLIQLRQARLGVKASEETLEKQRISATGKKRSAESIEKFIISATGLKRSKDFCLTISKAQKGKAKSESHKLKIKESLTGRTQSVETRLKRGDSLRGITQKIVKCEHCNIKGGISCMKRWHFDNCKHNPNK